MSPTHLTFGAAAAKSRRSKSGNGRRFLSGRVRFTRRLRTRATSWWRAIDAATVFTLTRQPAATRSAYTRGDPYVAPEASKEARTAASKAARRRSAGVGGR